MKINDIDNLTLEEARESLKIMYGGGAPPCNYHAGCPIGAPQSCHKCEVEHTIVVAKKRVQALRNGENLVDKRLHLRIDFL